MNTMDLKGKKLLIRPEVAESANKANVIVGEPRKDKEDNRVKDCLPTENVVII